MSDILKLKSYSNLKKQQVFISDLTLRKMFSEEEGREKHFFCENDFFEMDYSKTHIDEKTEDLLNRFAEDCQVSQKMEQLFAGERVNFTENLPAIHRAWRANQSQDIRFEGRNIMPEIHEIHEKMKSFCDAIEKGEKRGASGKRFFDIVHVGIGGSSLFVKNLTTALGLHKKAGLGLHFVETADGADLAEIKKKLQPETTLFIIASKSFRTTETLLNAAYVKEWIDDKLGTGAYRHHMVAVTANVKNAHQFGITEDFTFSFKNWLIGRFSSFSPISLAVPLLCGWTIFEEAMRGAQKIDEELKNKKINETMAYKLASLSVLYRLFWGTTTEGFFPYLSSLRHFPHCIEVLETESNGKNGEGLPTAPFVIKGLGTEVEHYLFQKYMQSGEKTLSTFIIDITTDKRDQELYKAQIIHALAATESLAVGRLKTKELDDYQVSEGNQPSILLGIKNYSPATIGALIALYEYKTILEGFWMGINPFDNFGFEGAKELAQKLTQNGKGELSSTNQWMERLKG